MTAPTEPTNTTRQKRAEQHERPPPTFHDGVLCAPFALRCGAFAVCVCAPPWPSGARVRPAVRACVCVRPLFAAAAIMLWDVVAPSCERMGREGEKRRKGGETAALAETNKQRILGYRMTMRGRLDCTVIVQHQSQKNKGPPSHLSFCSTKRTRERELKIMDTPLGRMNF